MTAMRKLWHILSRTVFWHYDRGTWQYDVLVVAIVLFVFLSPRGWFHDQPQAGPAPHGEEIALLAEDAAAGTRTYRVDVHLLAVPQRTPELERKAHDVLRKGVADLGARNFRVERIDAVVDDNGNVLYYAVQVK